MNSSFISLLALIMMAASAAAGADPQADTAHERQILLTLKQTDAGTLRLTGPPGKSYLKRRGYRGSPETEKLLDQIAEQYELERLDGWPIRSLGVYCEVFGLHEEQEVDGVLDQLAEDPRVESVQAMNTFQVLAGRYDDPYFDLQAGMQTLNVDTAHRWASGKGVKVAVVDTAVDHTHPDLKDQVLISHDFVLDEKAPAGTGELHGTAVAGIIASAANNHGIVGVAPNVRVLALKACWPVTPSSVAAHCSSFTLAKAIEFAVSHRARVLNLSLTGPQDALLTRLVSGAIEQGMIVVTAKPAGTSAGFPASVPDVIAVESADDPERGAYSAGRAAGPVAAPGHNILTTAPNSGYEFLSGSSLAAAYVSGITALLLEVDDMLTSRRVGELLAASGHDGGGLVLVDACAALAQVTESVDCGAQFADADAELH